MNGSPVRRLYGRQGPFFGLYLVFVFLCLPACQHVTGVYARSPQVVISEFMAVNDGTLVDADGDPSDWIEIYNQGPTDVDLGSWYLTDDRRDPVKWQFPQTRLPAHSYLVVFASGKDRAIAGAELHTNFRLPGDGEYLGLVAPDGWAIVWEYAPLYPQQFSGVSYGVVAALQARYLTAPSPGAANTLDAANVGPVLSNVRHTPAQPTADQPTAVTAVVQETLYPVDAVTMYCRIMYGNTHAVPMFDDGAHEDGRPGDGVYGGVIPSGLYGAGDLVRYYVAATDRQGHASRWPLFHQATNSPQYTGTMVHEPSVRSELPVLYWFVADPAAAETDAGTRASVFYDGVLYDNVLVRLRGLTARYWPKKSLKFDFNQGYHFRYAPDERPVEEFNLNSTVTDKSYIRQVLSWETFRDAGAPYSISFPLRVQQNGTFYSVSTFVEQPDERYLVRQGLDPAGALYKMKKRNVIDSTTENVEKRTGLDHDRSDLQALIDGLGLSPEARARYLFDHVDIPQVINYLAVATILHDRDHGDNNYYMYRDTRGTGEWMVLPWDKDMTFGRTYLPDQGGTFNDVIWANRDPESHPLRGYYVGNRLFDAMLDAPVIREMYLRRLRTVMDAFLQPPEMPVARRYFERRIDQLYARMAPDVVLDTERWQLSWGEPQSFVEAVDMIKTDYLPARRMHLYRVHGPENGGIIPDAQPASTVIDFGEIEFDPPLGDQDQEYVTLVNHSDSAVDISGWRIGYGIEYSFQSGVVIPPGGRVYVSPNVVAFRSRSHSPTGNEGLFVQGNYRGHLSNTWGVLHLTNRDNRRVALKVFYSHPSRR